MRISMKEGFDRTQIDFEKMAQLEKSQGTYPIFTQYFSIEQLSIADEEPLRNELQAFALAVRTGKDPVVTGDHGLQAVEVATRIQGSIRETQERYFAKRAERQG